VNLSQKDAYALATSQEQRPLLQRAWFVSMCVQISTFSTGSLFAAFILRNSVGWQGHFENLMTTVIPMLIIGAPIYWFSRKRLARQKPSRQLGVLLKIQAVVLGVVAIAMMVIVLEPSTRSSWTPVATESWSAWLIIGWLWLMAALSMLVGDSQIRMARSTAESEPK
jgi:magnesium-transporting ATPase (P-type)